MGKKIREVESLREEIKFIKRYVNLHNKVKSRYTILLFIKELQKAIVQKRIRKTSRYSEQIERIQVHLLRFYNSGNDEKIFKLNTEELPKLIAIAGGETLYPSIAVIKRFIGMQGKEVADKKIESFITHMEKLVRTKKLGKDDPYKDKINFIYSTLKLRKDNIISVSKNELNGLQGIVKECSCENRLGQIYSRKPRSPKRRVRSCGKKTFSDSYNKGACSHNWGLAGVLTAEEMANRKLDLLNFSAFWLTLFGMPAKNFTMMFHGEPHNGKTIFLLKLAQYLAENFGDVLYVSSEEFASPTMTKKVQEFLNPFPKRLHFAENLKDPDLSKYQFVILDSVNDLGLKINEYKEMRKTYPDTSFIFILQHTKSGDFRGGKDWEHLAEIVGEVHKGNITVTKNRYAPKTSSDFFKQFGMQWQDPTTEQNLKPYPLSGEMVASNGEHY